jgi:hypothetical protein
MKVVDLKGIHGAVITVDVQVGRHPWVVGAKTLVVTVGVEETVSVIMNVIVTVIPATFATLVTVICCVRGTVVGLETT